MKLSRLLVAAFLVSVASSLQAVGAAQRALLVGVSRSPQLQTLPGYRPLKGPINDVVLMESLLRRFGITNIEVLSPEPTRAMILRSFRRLAEQAASGDFIVIYLAAHGTRQPDLNGDEADNWDEVFLPSDAAPPDIVGGPFRNAIVDDDIGKMIASIRQKQAFVWFLADTCFSGTLNRHDTKADGSIVYRGLSYPGQTSVGSETAEDQIDLAKPDPGVVAFFATRANEKAPELPLPRPGDPSHGLLTYTLCEVLEQCPWPISYGQLARQIRLAYGAQSFMTPHMTTSGNEEDTVLKSCLWPEPSGIILHKEGKVLGLSAGRLFGLGENSIVRTSGAESGKVGAAIRYFKVISCEATRSIVIPVAHNSVSAPRLNDLVTGARCIVEDWGPAAFTLRLALEKNLSGSVRNALSQMEDDPVLQKRMLQVANVHDAHWALRQNGASVWLSAGASTKSSIEFEIGMESDPHDLTRKLRSVLRGIVRATTLLRLAKSAHSNPTLGLDIQGRLQSAGGSAKPLERQNEVVRPGDRLGFALENRGREKLDVTLFCIDSHFGITALPLSVFGTRRMEPGEHFQSVFYPVTDETFGSEAVIAIGVRSAGSRLENLSFLEQAGVEAARSDDRSRASQSLQRLLDGVGGRSDGSGMNDCVAEAVEYEIRRN